MVPYEKTFTPLPALKEILCSIGVVPKMFLATVSKLNLLELLPRNTFLSVVVKIKIVSFCGTKTLIGEISKVNLGFSSPPVNEYKSKIVKENNGCRLSGVRTFANVVLKSIISPASPLKVLVL
jgi:hypothetical protein